MRRATPFAICAALALLAGCGTKQAARPDEAANTADASGNDDVEALPSDGLTAPEGMALDSESNTAVEGNAAGSASGDNAM